MSPPDEPVDVELSLDERGFLANALIHWLGPAHASPELCIVLGYETPQSFHEDLGRLIGAVRATQPLSRIEWMRSLLIAQLAIGSPLIGSPLDWEPCTGQTLSDGLATLHLLEEKLRSQFLGVRPRNTIYQGVYQDLATTIWSHFTDDELGPVDWQSLAAVGLAEALLPWGTESLSAIHAPGHEPSSLEIRILPGPNGPSVEWGRLADQQGRSPGPRRKPAPETPEAG